MWLWWGEPTLSPQFADLLDRRFDGLDLTSLDALGLLVLGEPLPLALVQDLVGLDAMVELEGRRIVAATARCGVLSYRFAHPMLATAAARLISPAQRRRLANTLAAAHHDGVDVVRRAMWLLDTSDPPDVEVLIDAARTVFLTQPALARQLAERAQPHDPGPHSALLVANASAEIGDFEAARDAQQAASARARHRCGPVGGTPEPREPDRLHRPSTRPGDRHAGRAARRVARRSGARDRRDGRPASGLLGAPSRRARHGGTCARSIPVTNAFIDACNVRVIALALVDRTGEAITAATELLAEVASAPALPYATGIAHIAAHVARFVSWIDPDEPRAEPCGRWPVAGHDGAGGVPVPVRHPLFEGGRRLLEGHPTRAVAPLREAVAQQLIGEGLLRSEAVALLGVALAYTGELAEAQRLLASTPPDRVGLFAGLRPWAESAVAAAAGRPEAVQLALDAYDQARAAGSQVGAVAYLAAAADYGSAGRAAQLLDTWGPTARRADQQSSGDGRSPPGRAATATSCSTPRNVTSSSDCYATPSTSPNWPPPRIDTARRRCRPGPEISTPASGNSSTATTPPPRPPKGSS